MHQASIKGLVGCGTLLVFWTLITGVASTTVTNISDNIEVNHNVTSRWTHSDFVNTSSVDSVNISSSSDSIAVMNTAFSHENLSSSSSPPTNELIANISYVAFSEHSTYDYDQSVVNDSFVDAGFYVVKEVDDDTEDESSVVSTTTASVVISVANQSLDSSFRHLLQQNNDYRVTKSSSSSSSSSSITTAESTDRPSMTTSHLPNVHNVSLVSIETPTTLQPATESHTFSQATLSTSVVWHRAVVNPEIAGMSRPRDDDDDDDDDYGQFMFQSGAAETTPGVFFDFRRQCVRELSGNVWWNRTYGGVIAVRYCPEGYTGKVYRMCYYGGTWGEVDFSECRVQHLIKLKHLLYYHVHKNLTEGFHNLADELLSTLVRYKLRSVDDYIESLDSLNTIINARVPLDFDLGQDFKYLKAILKISDILFSKFDNKWQFPQDQQDMVTMKLVQILHGMTHFGNQVAEGIKRSSRSLVMYTDYSHIGLEAKVIRGDEAYKSSPPTTGSSVHLPARLYKIPGSSDKYVVVTMWYSGFMSSLEEDGGHVDSAIFATTIHPGHDVHLLTGPVTASLRINEKVHDDDLIECGFLRRTFNRSSLWSRAGCTVSEVRVTSVTCICHHMTNIAVVVRPKHHEGHVPWRPVTVAVMVGGSISLVVLLLTFVAHIHVLRYESSEYSVILLNLIFSMITAQVVFMVGVQATSRTEICEGIAIVLHYVYLVSSFWLLSHSIHVYVNTRIDKEKPSCGHMRDYCLLSWIVPVVLVVITFAVNPRGYEIRKYCWLSIERGMLISYIVPIFCLIIVNTSLMVLVLKRLFENQICMKKSEIDRSRTLIRAGVILLPYHGVNWFFGVLAMEDRITDIFQTIFGITSAIQGLLIFLFFGFLSSEVRKVIRQMTSKVLRRRTSSDFKLRRNKRRRSKFDAEPLLVVHQENYSCHLHQGSSLVAQCLSGSEEPFILSEDRLPIT